MSATILVTGVGRVSGGAIHLKINQLPGRRVTRRKAANAAILLIASPPRRVTARANVRHRQPCVYAPNPTYNLLGRVTAVV